MVKTSTEIFMFKTPYKNINDLSAMENLMIKILFRYNSLNLHAK